MSEELKPEALDVASPALPVARMSDAELSWRLSERQALAISKAQVAVPKHFAGKPADIMAVWMMADELGLSRNAALRSAYVVNGKVQLSGDLLLAIARAAGARVEETLVRDEAEPEDTSMWVAVCKVTLPSGEVVERSFSAREAHVAGLWGSSDPWKKYPARMLQMRARGFACRDAVPDRLAGIYAEGELIDITPAEE